MSGRRGRCAAGCVRTSWNRVRMDAKTGSLAREIADLDTVVVDNEREALALEHSFIKLYKPRFNVILRDDRPLSVYQVHGFGKISACVFHEAGEERRVVVLRSVFSSGFGAAYPALRAQAIPRAVVFCGFDEEPSEARACSTTSTCVSGLVSRG